MAKGAPKSSVLEGVDGVNQLIMACHLIRYWLEGILGEKVPIFSLGQGKGKSSYTASWAERNGGLHASIRVYRTGRRYQELLIGRIE